MLPVSKERLVFCLEQVWDHRSTTILTNFLFISYGINFRDKIWSYFQFYNFCNCPYINKYSWASSSVWYRYFKKCWFLDIWGISIQALWDSTKQNFSKRPYRIPKSQGKILSKYNELLVWHSKQSVEKFPWRHARDFSGHATLHKSRLSQLTERGQCEETNASPEATMKQNRGVNDSVSWG